MEELRANIKKIVGHLDFPLTIWQAPDGALSLKYETEWKEGGTTPVRQKDGTIEYKENYTNKKLTKAQIKKLDAYIATLKSS